MNAKSTLRVLGAHNRVVLERYRGHQGVKETVRADLLTKKEARNPEQT